MMLTKDETKVFELIQTGETERVLQLIREGDVRINCIDESGMNFLDQASFKGNETLVEKLLELGADSDNREHPHGYTCLMFAALAGKPRICEMLLNAGARAHATNKMGKGAGEMAAFVGNFECVSMINSFIGYEDIEVLVHPNGEKSEKVYPKEFVEYIHRLTRTHFIHPVVIVHSISSNPSVLEHRKKLVWTVDRLFERQLRSKQPNEILALKLWLILTILRELVNFLQSKTANQEETNEELLQQHLKTFLKNMVEWRQEDGRIYRKRLETFLSAAVSGFPYKHSMGFKALGHSMKGMEFGRAPNMFTLICATLFGQRYAQAAFCSYCGRANAEKCCSICKVAYCSAECQRADWSGHKKVCSALKDNPTQNAYMISPTDEISTLTLEDVKETSALASDHLEAKEDKRPTQSDNLEKS